MIQTAPRTLEPLSGTKTVLLIDDAESAREVLSSQLRQQFGYRVVEASSLAESRYLSVVEEKIHLVLMGLETSMDNDLEMVKRFRTLNPEMRILVNNGSLWELEFQEDECQPILRMKSYTTGELIATVRRMLE